MSGDVKAKIEPLCLNLSQKYLEDMRKKLHDDDLKQKMMQEKALAIWNWVQAFCKTDVYLHPNIVQKNDDRVFLYWKYGHFVFISRNRNTLHDNNQPYTSAEALFKGCDFIDDLFEHIQSDQVYKSIMPALTIPT